MIKRKSAQSTIKSDEQLFNDFVSGTADSQLLSNFVSGTSDSQLLSDFVNETPNKSSPPTVNPINKTQKRKVYSSKNLNDLNLIAKCILIVHCFVCVLYGSSTFINMPFDMDSIIDFLHATNPSEDVMSRAVNACVHPMFVLVSNTFFLPIVTISLLWISHERYKWLILHRCTCLIYLCWESFHLTTLIIDFTNCNNLTFGIPDTPHCINYNYPLVTNPSPSFILMISSLVANMLCLFFWLGFEGRCEEHSETKNKKE